MKTFKYLILSALCIGLVGCENETLDDLRDRNNVEEVVLPDLTAGSADFSNFVSVGASFTAGFTDGALFQASQQNSYPKIMSDQFAKIGGGSFTQPLTNDNFGGLALAGNRIAGPRLVFGGAGPVPLESVIGPVTVTTDIALNNPTGPFNNLGVPGAKSFHFIAPGFGNLNNIPDAANPYAVRLTGSTPNASIIELAVAQNPSFFVATLFGGNDVLGYATSGGNGSNPLTDTATFDFAVNTALDALTANGAQGVITNVPNVTSISYFTTVSHNPLEPSNETFGPLIPTLNTLFGALNDVYAFLESQGAIDDATERTIVFSETGPSAVVIKDESLDNIAPLITNTLVANPAFPAFLAQFGLPAEAAPLVAALLGNFYGQARQATADDLITLPSASVIGTINQDTFNLLTSQGLSPEIAGQFSVEGVTNPLADTWVLIPSEQAEVAEAVNAYNATIEAQAAARGLALVDLEAILEQASTVGVQFDSYLLNTDLVFGGLVSLDGIHLTARGYAFMANAFLEAIDNTYGSNFVESGNVAKAGDYPTNYSPTLGL